MLEYRHVALTPVWFLALPVCGLEPPASFLFVKPVTAILHPIAGAALILSLPSLSLRELPDCTGHTHLAILYSVGEQPSVCSLYRIYHVTA